MRFLIFSHQFWRRLQSTLINFVCSPGVKTKTMVFENFNQNHLFLSYIFYISKIYFTLALAGRLKLRLAFGWSCCYGSQRRCVNYFPRSKGQSSKFNFQEKMITKITLNPKFFANRFSHSNFIQENEWQFS